MADEDDLKLVNKFSNIGFPIVRRVFSGLMVNQLISVQPMTAPTGLIFYTDYKYPPIPYKSLDIGFRTKNIRSWMYSDVENKTLRDLDTDPLPLP